MRGTKRRSAPELLWHSGVLSVSNSTVVWRQAAHAIDRRPSYARGKPAPLPLDQPVEPLCVRRTPLPLLKGDGLRGSQDANYPSTSPPKAKVSGAGS